ncbi:MAG: hypothetical protein HY326_01975 [Chloroflexi bacterium]|nr:hypothetical protein [Chloroflexota bacterium]
MHSSTELASSMFHIELDSGRTLPSFAALIPGFTSQDRLGVVVRHSLDGIWTSGLILAAVTAFYDEQRKQSGDFFIYPDYFIFHAGCRPGFYSMFDVWPDHKCVQINDTPEDILRAVNDRGVNILVLPEIMPSTATAPRPMEIQRQTRSSALGRIKSAFLYNPSAPIHPPNVQVVSNPVVERYVTTAIDKTQGLAEEERQAIHQRRQDLVNSSPAGNAVESYRCLSPAEAIGLL